MPQAAEQSLEGESGRIWRDDEMALFLQSWAGWALRAGCVGGRFYLGWHLFAGN